MLDFIRYVAEAVVLVGVKRLAGSVVPFGGFVVELAGKVIERYGVQRQLDRLRTDLQQMLQAHRDQVRAVVEAVVREVLPEDRPGERAQLAGYLEQMPDVARRSLSRPEDREGKTVPAALRLEEPVQLAQLLPLRLPQFTPGQQLPGAENWQLVKLLGVGGFGEVWLAENRDISLKRAVKFCLNPQARQQLLAHEGQLVHKILSFSRSCADDVHGIVPLLDARLDVEPPWLAYEYVDGGDLSDIIAQQAQCPPRERGPLALQYAIVLGQVVGRFHRLRPPIVHRDLKPSNILVQYVAQQQRVRVSDFGISQIVAEGELERAQQGIVTATQATAHHFRGAYTPLYASPQQQRGLPPDTRDDVYSLGIIAWQLLTGDLLRGRPSGREARREICERCGLPRAVVDILERCWDDEPGERPSDGLALAESLQQALTPPKAGGRSNIAFSRSSWADVDRDYEDYLHCLQRGHGLRGWLAQRYMDRLSRWEQAAEEGCPKAMVLLAECYREGLGVPQNYKDVLEWYRKAAEAGNAEALKRIIHMYRYREGVAVDYDEALQWYCKAAEAGDADAMFNIGAMYHNGDWVPQDYDEALRWYRKAAQAGQADAMLNVGKMYEIGEGVPQDYQEALRWYRKAAEGGSAAAANNVGVMYQKGLGIQQDYQEALRWYHKAAGAGRVDAMVNIARLCERGQGVPQDYREAFRWYLKAAETSNVDAMLNVGRMYETGVGVPQDYQQALQWYRRAADAGNADAMVNVGLMYQRGYGVQQDYEEALRWFLKADAKGCRQAKGKIRIFKWLRAGSFIWWVFILIPVIMMIIIWSLAVAISVCLI
jgi:TPR repeat protein/serine/threonine protein kinase